MAEILHPFLPKFGQILWGNIDLYFFEKECFHSSFYSDYPSFLKRPGKSGSARLPRGMKLGNIFPAVRTMFLIPLVPVLDAFMCIG